jgi:excisionase family DNA binding protein
VEDIMEQATEVPRAERRRKLSKSVFSQNPMGFPTAPLEKDKVEQAPANLHGVGAMSIKGFCDWGNIGLSTFYKEVTSGRLKVVKVGRKTLVRMSDALAWLAALTEPDPQERYGSPKPRKAEAHIPMARTRAQLKETK